MSAMGLFLPERIRTPRYTVGQSFANTRCSSRDWRITGRIVKLPGADLWAPIGHQVYAGRVTRLRQLPNMDCSRLSVGVSALRPLAVRILRSRRSPPFMLQWVRPVGRARA